MVQVGLDHSQRTSLQACRLQSCNGSHRNTDVGTPPETKKSLYQFELEMMFAHSWALLGEDSDFGCLFRALKKASTIRCGLPCPHLQGLQ